MRYFPGVGEACVGKHGFGRQTGIQGTRIDGVHAAVVHLRDRIRRRRWIGQREGRHRDRAGRMHVREHRTVIFQKCSVARHAHIQLHVVHGLTILIHQPET